MFVIYTTLQKFGVSNSCGFFVGTFYLNTSYLQRMHAWFWNRAEIFSFGPWCLRFISGEACEMSESVLLLAELRAGFFSPLLFPKYLVLRGTHTTLSCLSISIICLPTILSLTPYKNHRNMPSEYFKPTVF